MNKPSCNLPGTHVLSKVLHTSEWTHHCIPPNSMQLLQLLRVRNYISIDSIDVWGASSSLHSSNAGSQGPWLLLHHFHSAVELREPELLEDSRYGDGDGHREEHLLDRLARRTLDLDCWEVSGSVWEAFLGLPQNLPGFWFFKSTFEGDLSALTSQKKVGAESSSRKSSPVEDVGSS